MTENTEHILEDLEATITEIRSLAQNATIRTNYEFGRVFYQLSQELSTTEALGILKARFKRGEKSLYDYRNFYTKVTSEYTNLDHFIVSYEHSGSWNRIRHNFLGATKTEDKKIDPHTKGYKLGGGHIKKHGISYAKQYIGGYSESITDNNEEN